VKISEMLKNKESIDKACVHCVTGYTTGEFAICTAAHNYTTIMFHLKACRCWHTMKTY